jgi:membrane protease YdiL (CAAX protease family)
MVMTFGFLGAAMLVLGIPGGKGEGLGRLWVWLALAALGSALIAGIVQPVGLIGIALWVVVVREWVRFVRAAKAPAWHGLLAVAVLGLAAALMLHRVPGFVNPRVIDAVRFTPDAVPFTLYLNFDKTLIGLLLFGWVLPRIASGREWREVLVTILPRALLVIAVVLIASLALGYVRWAPKLPDQTWLWLGVNLFFVCPAEEALFRGFIQGGLRRAWAGWPGGKWAALAVAAVAFGLAHAAGGVSYVLLATVAGAGYGWIYERTQRVEAAVLAHFGLNAAHFLLFTYPALARGP